MKTRRGKTTKTTKKGIPGSSTFGAAAAVVTSSLIFLCVKMASVNALPNDQNNFLPSNIKLKLETAITLTEQNRTE